jgi:AhpD family alkylhydroperoxidase
LITASQIAVAASLHLRIIPPRLIECKPGVAVGISLPDAAEILLPHAWDEFRKEQTMKQRFDLTEVAAAGYKALLGVHGYVQKSGLDLGLLELVKVRASQINGCAFCLAMHVPLARQHGVSEDQLNLLVAWREAPVFSVRERAALAWAESMTNLKDGDVPDSIYEPLSQQFSIKEIADLSFAVAEINAWNRLMVCSRTSPVLAADQH